MMVVYPGRGERIEDVTDLLTSASGWRGRAGAPKAEGQGGPRRSFQTTNQWTVGTLNPCWTHLVLVECLDIREWGGRRGSRVRARRGRIESRRHRYRRGLEEGSCEPNFRG